MKHLFVLGADAFRSATARTRTVDVDRHSCRLGRERGSALRRETGRGRPALLPLTHPFTLLQAIVQTRTLLDSVASPHSPFAVLPPPPHVPPFPPSSPGRPPSQHRSANTNGPPVFVRPDLQPKSHPLRFLLAGPNLLPCSPALLHFCSPHLSLLPNNPTTSHKQSQAANTHTRSSRVTALRSQLPLRIPTSSQINSSPGSAYLHLIT